MLGFAFTSMRMAIFATLLAIAPVPATQAFAGDGCTGVVQGLSSTYNFRTGSGFLAVRAGPTTRSQMIDQLFNGDHVQIFDRQGNWYQIAYSRGSGWAYARYIWNECGY